MSGWGSAWHPAALGRCGDSVRLLGAGPGVWHSDLGSRWVQNQLPSVKHTHLRRTRHLRQWVQRRAGPPHGSLPPKALAPLTVTLAWVLGLILRLLQGLP